MANDKKQEPLTMAEATRQTWKELGAKASGVDVAEVVKSRHGFKVPSSTVSLTKKQVFSRKKKGKAVSSGASSASSSGAQPPELKSKAQVVRELLSTGMQGPTEISKAARKLGHVITPSHVSMIKSNDKKLGRKKGRRPAAASGRPAASNAPGSASNLELENAALKLALKAGSVQAALQALGRLE